MKAYMVSWYFLKESSKLLEVLRSYVLHDKEP